MNTNNALLPWAELNTYSISFNLHIIVGNNENRNALQESFTSRCKQALSCEIQVNDLQCDRMTLLKFYRKDFLQWNTINKMIVKSGYSYASNIKEVNVSSPMDEWKVERICFNKEKNGPWSNTFTVITQFTKITMFS